MLLNRKPHLLITGFDGEAAKNPAVANAVRHLATHEHLQGRIHVVSSATPVKRLADLGAPTDAVLGLA